VIVAQDPAPVGEYVARHLLGLGVPAFQLGQPR
jgi:hypothetical protein